MGYSHGRKWSDELIQQEVLSIMKVLGISRMPTKSECEQVTGNKALTNAISKRFGWYKLAEYMGLEIKNSETTTGKMAEKLAENILIENNFSVERMSQNHPFDLLVDNCVKIDVKASHLYTCENGSYYSFALGNINHSCDFYMLVELDDNDKVVRVMIVPSVFIMKTTQISTGVNSKYNIYTNRFDYIKGLSDYWKERGKNESGLY